MKLLKQPQLDALLSFLEDEDDYVFLDTARSDAENRKSLLFLQPKERLTCLPGDDPAVFAAKLEDALIRGYYLAGWISYEFGYLLEGKFASSLQYPADTKQSLASFGVYSDPLVFDHETGDNSLPGKQVPPTFSGFYIQNLRPSQEKESYLAAIGRIKEYIAAGDTYQVNYTLKLLFDFAGLAEGLYRDLRRNQSVAYGALMRSGREHILSLSPELFFRVETDSITVRPMKGTMKRGRYLEEDQKFCRELNADPKNRSENVMIVDLLRNDLGRLIHQFGEEQVITKSLFDVERYESVLQMTSTVFARTGGGIFSKVPLKDFFRALFPCGSVTGAPKIRTMEIIRELEESPRGIYTGAIGYISPAGTATFNVPIRTIRLADGKGEMGIGSGIIHDSNPEEEWGECLLKSHFLTSHLSEFLLIETLLWEPEKGYWLLGEHLQRLEESATYFSYSFDRQEVLDTLEQLEEKFSGVCMRVRLTLAKDGCLETSFQVCNAPSLRTLPSTPLEEEEGLPGIILSEKQVDSSSPWYFHKTTQRNLFQKEFAAAREQGLFDVCFVNERQELTEGSISNLILFLDGKYYTPPVSSGLLNGTLRRKLLADNPSHLFEKKLSPEDLVRADGLFCCNAVRGLVQVRLAS
ncbi:MAG: aminodeoxychorismate synthase component I [Desulfocapsa sp.]|nr:aminodeoxychorismate synthase component I [Desulfocapsa sp.]